MKADLYVQGHFWATIIIPGDGLLALLAKGIIAEATRKCELMAQDLADLHNVHCSISLRFRDPVPDTPDTETQP